MTSTRLKSSCFFISVISLIVCSCETISALKSPSSAIIPAKYHLHINTKLHQNIFTYNESISIDLTVVREPTTEIVLNCSKRLHVLDITLISRVTQRYLGLQWNVDIGNEQLRINIPEKLKTADKYQLRINLVDDNPEFYKSKNSHEYENYVTYFHPVGFHRAFPFFDKPTIKTKFSLSITHDPKFTAISDMPADGEPVLSLTSNGKITTTKFLDTPPSSYDLISFALTNYKSNSILVNGLQHRFFYPPNSKDNGSRALECAIKAVDGLEKLIGIKYGLTKLDQIQVEKLNGNGAIVGSWGLLASKQNYTLYNQKDEKNDLLLKILLQHQIIAVQLFENLVTLSSKNYNWLLDGFRVYFGTVTADLAYPKEKILEYFIIKQDSYSFAKDLKRPLTSDEPEDSDIVSNTIAPGFIRMVHHAIGQSTFMKGILKYLSKFQYSFADEDDFFGALQEAVDEDKVHIFQNNQSVAKVMRTWTRNLGIPTITIIRNYDTGTITIRQKSNSEIKGDQKWWIPMNFATASNPDFERTAADYIMPPQAEVTLDLKDLNISLSSSDWLIVNKQQTGQFFVAYDVHNLKLITEGLKAKPKNIHLFNRHLILRDLKETFDGKNDAVEPIFELLQNMKTFEEEPLPWLNALDLLNIIIRRSSTQLFETFADFKSFIKDIFYEMFTKTKSKPEEFLTFTEQQLLDTNSYLEGDTVQPYF